MPYFYSYSVKAGRICKIGQICLKMQLPAAELKSEITAAICSKQFCTCSPLRTLKQIVKRITHSCLSLTVSRQRKESLWKRFNRNRKHKRKRVSTKDNTWIFVGTTTYRVYWKHWAQVWNNQAITFRNNVCSWCTKSWGWLHVESCKHAIKAKSMKR